MHVKIIPFGTHCDVFFGKEGWEPWARFKLSKSTKGTFLTHECGDKVPPYVMSILIKRFNGN